MKCRPGLSSVCRFSKSFSQKVRDDSEQIVETADLFHMVPAADDLMICNGITGKIVRAAGKPDPDLCPAEIRLMEILLDNAGSGKIPGEISLRLEHRAGACRNVSRQRDADSGSYFYLLQSNLQNIYYIQA